MSRLTWSNEVSTISSTLQTLEEHVEHGGVAAQGLEDLKSALDDLRLRAWGLLMAASADDYRGFQERFRIRRTREMCAALSADLRTGKLSAANPELPALGTAARDVATSVDDARRMV